MSLTRSIAHNTMIQIVGRVISTMLTLVVFFLVARHLGVDQYGALTTATAFLQLFGLVVDLGLYIYLAKALGDQDQRSDVIVGNVFSLRLVSAVVILGIAPLVVLAMPYPAVVKSGVVLLSLSSLAVTLTQVLAGVFQRALRTSRFIASEVLGRAVLLGATLLAIQHGAGVLGIILTVVIGSLVTFVATFLTARRIVPFKFRIDLDVWRAILKQTWPIALSIAFNVVYFKADTIILSLYHSQHDVGIYGAPYRFLEAFVSIPAMIAGLLTPLLSESFRLDQQRFGRILQRGFEMLMFLAVPLVVGTQFVAKGIMSFVAPSFADSAPVLQLLIVATGAIFLGYLFSNAVIVVNQQRRMVWAYGSIAVLSIVLYLLTIPKFSYYGAATVTILVETLIAVVSAWVVLRVSRVRLNFVIPGKTLFAGGVMAVGMFVAHGLPWVVNGMIGIFVYGAASYAFGVFDRKLLLDIVARRSEE
jgi:O-antigen/teichoic acid export membrane protein